MRENPPTEFNAYSSDARDCYKCVHCLKLVSIKDSFCRGCGDEICDKEKQLMRAKLKELAQNNLPSLILCMGFVLAIIGGSIWLNA
jgi:hypothetical protein